MKSRRADVPSASFHLFRVPVADRMSALRAGGLAFLLPFLAAQAQEIRRAEPVVPEGRPAVPVSGTVSIDDQARFLAGVPGDASSPLKPLETSNAWQAHARAFDILWTRAQRGRHAQMRQWSISRVLARVGTPNTLYYMFGGPDFVTAQVFFPGTPNFILGGLEPIGQIPDLRSLTPDQLASSLRNLRGAMNSLLQLGFFETKDMKTDLRRSPVQGVMPLVYAMMVRSGETLLDQSYFTLSSGGDPNETATPTSAAVNGLKITFRPTSGGDKRIFYYLDGDISNGSTVGQITKFLGRFPAAGSYLKAASYLMHESNFSTIRDFLLAESRFILQDDSGIPLTRFDPAKWEILPFGNYRGVMPAFKKYYQPELRQLYSNEAGDMPFGLGYRVSDADASQILAIRR